MILLMALLFGYYASLELEMPFSREMLLPAAGVIIGLAALWASFASQRDGVSYFPMWRPAAFAAIFSIAPLVMWVMMVSQPLQPETGSGYPVRVMTYNLHNGFNTDGRLDPGASGRGYRIRETRHPSPAGGVPGVGSSTAPSTCCYGFPAVSTCRTCTVLPQAICGVTPYSRASR